MGYKINLHKSVASNKKVSEREIKKTIPFIIASKRIKLGVNITTEVKNLYIKNYKILLNVTEEDTSKWKNILCSLLGRINIVKMPIPQLKIASLVLKSHDSQTKI